MKGSARTFKAKVVLVEKTTDKKVIVELILKTTKNKSDCKISEVMDKREIKEVS